MTVFALDSNIVSFVMKNQEPVKSRLLDTPAENVAIPSIVLAELCYGRHNNPARSAHLGLAIQQFKDCYPILDFNASAAEWYGMIRFESREQPVGDRDLLIAAICLAHGCTLVTHNTREFERIPGLHTVDWTKPLPKVSGPRRR